MDKTKTRILKGIDYLMPISPKQWNMANTVHLKVLLKLMKEYLEDEEYKQAKEIFGNP